MAAERARYVSILKNGELFYKGYFPLKLVTNNSKEDLKEKLKVNYSFSEHSVGLTKINMGKILDSETLQRLKEEVSLLDDKYYLYTLTNIDSADTSLVQIFEEEDLLLETYVENKVFESKPFAFSTDKVYSVPLAIQFQQVILNMYHQPKNDLGNRDVVRYVKNPNTFAFEEYLTDGHIYQNGEVVKGIGNCESKIIKNGLTTMYSGVNKNNYFKYDYEPGKLVFKLDGEVVYQFIGNFEEKEYPIQFWDDRRQNIFVKLHTFEGTLIRYNTKKLEIRN